MNVLIDSVHMFYSADTFQKHQHVLTCWTAEGTSICTYVDGHMLAHSGTIAMTVPFSSRMHWKHKAAFSHRECLYIASSKMWRDLSKGVISRKSWVLVLKRL